MIAIRLDQDLSTTRTPGLIAACLVLVVMLPAGGGAEPPERPVMLDDFETPGKWLTWAGDSPPLPTGGMNTDADAPHAGRRCGSFFYDVSSDHGYVASELRRPFPPRVTGLRFWIRSKGNVKLTVRLLDDSGQTHQHSAPQSPGPWCQVRLPLGKPWPHHYGGADDGEFHQPFRGLQILRESGSVPKKGTVFLDDIEVVTTATLKELGDWYWRDPQVRTETDVPGNLFCPGEPVVVRLSVAAPPIDVTLTARGRLYDAWARPTGDVRPIALDRSNGYSTTLEVPADPNYYRLTLAVTESRHSAVHETRFAVIPDNASGGADPDSPFGVNTHFNQGWPASLGEIAKRVGIGWIRDGEASLEDKALPVGLANGLCYLPCFTKWRGELAQRFKQREGRAAGADGGWDFSEAVKWHRQYAEKYGKDIDAYDLMNEPHGPWAEALGGDWRGGPWLRTFADYGLQVTEAIHAADPGAKVLWEDIDQLLWYRDFAKLPRASEIDVLSPHPYNLHRSRPFPEQQPVLEQMRDLEAMTKARQLRWEVWAGEVGFSSFRLSEQTGTMFYTPQTEAEQAQLLVRMMVLQLARGVKRIFWYDLRNDGWEPDNPEHNFGLIQNDHLPKPAVVAYANLIHRLRRAKWLRPYVIGGGAYAFAYLPEAPEAKPVLIAWVMTGESHESLPVTSGAERVTLVDLYGRRRAVRVAAKRLSLKLSPSPVYVEGLSEDDLLLGAPPNTYVAEAGGAEEG